MAYIQSLDTGLGAIISLQALQIIDINVAEAFVVPDVETLQQRVMREIQRCELVLETIQVLELWIMAQVEFCESASTAHKVLQLWVFSNVQFFERSGITLYIRHLRVVSYVERRKFRVVVTIYPDKIIKTCKVELGELVI